MNCDRLVNRLAFFVLGSLALVIPTGCGHTPDLPPMAPVSGQVTLDGKPLPRGTVQFVPEGTEDGNAALGVGHIDSNGHYEITTAGVKGAVVGFHKVCVSAREEMDPEGDPVTKSLIPERYALPESSGIRIEVKAGEDNDVPLPLKAKP